jgi:hypothetical protein
LYRYATGHNQNFVWCAAGFTSERFPNGLGFGGQVGHFSVFLNGYFEGGHTRDKGATYGAPSFSGETGVGLYRLNSVVTHSLKAPGFNPCT